MEQTAPRQEAPPPPSPIHQRVLVVGGAGQMGQWLSRYFRSRGREVIVNDPAGPLEGVAYAPDLEKGVREADVVAVSVPMSVSAEVLARIAELEPEALGFDVCRLRAPVEKVLRAA